MLIDNFTAYESLLDIKLSVPSSDILPSYLAALQGRLQPARHKTSAQEYQALTENFDKTWPVFTTEIANGIDDSDWCLERLYWLSRGTEFIGYMSLRTDLRGARQIYGGNAGRELYVPYRNQGLGTIGLELLKLIATAQNFSELVFVTAEDNIAALKSLHKCGAEIVERIPNPQNDYFQNNALKLKITL